MGAVQFYKGDAVELKYYNSAQPISDVLSAQKDLFLDDAYGCFVLGELLYDNDLAPLATAIPRDIFRETFETVFDNFIYAGTFESYMEVFRKVFGDDVDVEFTVPGAGQLQIAIEASGLQLSPFVARRIADNAYVYDNMVDDLGNRLVFQSVKGFETQEELEKMLFELVPDGVYTEISLTVG
jgi:hypothetical protein